MASCHLGGLSPIGVNAGESMPSYNPLWLLQYQHHHCIIRDGEMLQRGLTIMSDVFRKTVNISDIMSEISYRPIFD
jgi:hypothetical protein